MKDPYRDREKRRYEHPIASREAILTRMRAIAEPVSFKRLAKELGIDSHRDRESLQLRLGAMVRDGQIVGDQRNKYALAGKLELFAGVVSAHSDGYGFLICDENREDVFLSHRQMRAVFHGDRVMVRVRGRDRRGRDEGEIVEVLSRNTSELTGRVYFENRVPLMESLNRRIDHKIIIQNPPPELSEGQILATRIVEPPGLHRLPSVEIISVLGEHLTPDMQVEIALRNHDIPYEFPDDVIAEADALPGAISPRAKKQREDLRHLDFVTIDGADARDFDDAVYCEQRRGGYRLFVAIADVAHYVKPDTELDLEAGKRGTSVYFPQYVVPMLPEKLSNGLCSLNPDVDRLVMVCEMTLSQQGRIGGYQFYEAVIHSRERLTYTRMGEWIDRGAFPRHEQSLSNLVALAKILIDGRNDRGALDFDTREVSFRFDQSGRVASVGLVKRNLAHRLIEECMLCANVCAARLIARSGLPGLYRVHEEPEAEKVAWLTEFLATFGIDLGRGRAEDYQYALRALKAKQNSPILQMALLRSMQQAVYQPENRGHFGLGYSHYAHFTSPIRRYPDLLVHRLIKSLIHGRRDLKEVRRQGPSKRVSHYPYDAEMVLTQGEQASFTERRADEAVYEVLEWVKCDYLDERVGDDFKGVISAVTRFGFFVQLEEVLVEGLVHVSSLTGDYYHFDMGEQSLVAEKSGAAFGLGDMVTVQVARVDVDERKVDLELLTHTPIRRKKRVARKRRKQAVSRNSGSRGPGRRRRKR